MRMTAIAAALAATASLAFGAGSVSASTSCGRTIINDWYVDSSIDGTYSSECYRQALARVTDQMKVYSSLPDQLERGLRAALAREATSGALGTQKTITRPSSSRSTAGHRPSGPIQRVLGELGPARADSIPIPLLILAGIALLLIAAGAASAVHRRLGGRRNSR